jgi:hypothetical protein
MSRKPNSLPQELPQHASPGVDEMADVTMTLEEYEALRALITIERESEGAMLAAASPPKKRKGKKNPKLGRALREANQKLRKANGQLKKGVTQGDIMSMAHRLLKKM